MLDRIEPSVNRILTRMEEQVDRYDQPRTQGGSELAPVTEGDSHGGGEGEHAASAQPTSQEVAP